MKQFTIISFLLLFAATAVANDTPDYETQYYSNGAIKVDYSFEAGFVKVAHYHENGILVESGFIRKGQRHGMWRQWDENGNLVTEATYYNDKKVGFWRAWHANGNLKFEMEYRNGCRISAVQFDESGKVIANR